ncbi:MAG: hypothetical protein FJ118_09300 [Deltaproteobacteria bacterium]|nr:hypothetical protein [Deltaproteobacteria bacterium]
MKKQLTITKTKKLIRIRDIVDDLKSEKSDEEIKERFSVSWEQMGKIYARLFYGGFITEEDLVRRVELRDGRDASHIPLVRIDLPDCLFQCSLCGFTSSRHFSRCPRCREIHLRRLRKRASTDRVRHSGYSRVI